MIFRAADDPPAAPWPHGYKRKKPLPHTHGTKAVHFCDTTQIDVKTPARLRIPSYAPRWITGGIPVGLYSVALSIRPPKSIRQPSAAPITPSGTLCGLSAPVTSLHHRFELFLLVVRIITPERKMSRPGDEKFRVLFADLIG